MDPIPPCARFAACCVFAVAQLTVCILQFAVDVELVWSNALLYNSDPAHLVYVSLRARFRPLLCGVEAKPTFLRHQAALRGRDELWRTRTLTDILSKVASE